MGIPGMLMTSKGITVFTFHAKLRKAKKKNCFRNLDKKSLTGNKFSKKLLNLSFLIKYLMTRDKFD